MIDPAGPVVAVCTGHRCAALRRLDGEDDAVGESLRAAVCASRGGVLVSSTCAGRCARAPVAAVGYRDEGRAHPSSVVWLGDLDAGRRAAVAAWVATLGQARSTEHASVLGTLAVPPALQPAVLGIHLAGRAPATS